MIAHGAARARRIDLSPLDDPSIVVAAHPGIDLVLVFLPGRDRLAQAIAEAAIGPLAVIAAPAVRINAVFPSAESSPAAIEAAVAYLSAAHAVTGQLLVLGS
ncbi:Rossmann fold domain-containing protein [Sphingomonas sp.]|uniref:Rossmann fold domain-containing protein n=1 Tax=Sphingomonas sp. TaxID=28214 RepID=UPI0031CDE11A